jgi:hypothetical protein
MDMAKLGRKQRASEDRPALSPKSDDYLAWLDTMTPTYVVTKDGRVIPCTVDGLGRVLEGEKGRKP